MTNIDMLEKGRFFALLVLDGQGEKVGHEVAPSRSADQIDIAAKHYYKGSHTVYRVEYLDGRWCGKKQLYPPH